MGALTLTELLTEVQAGMGNRTEITQARYISALNIAQSRIGRFYDYQEMNQILTTTQVLTGDAVVDKYLTLPPRIKSIHSLVLIDGAQSNKLTEKPWRMFDRNVPLPSYIAPGWPYYYTRFGVQVVTLFPTPLQSFMFFLRATLLATPFTADALDVTSDFVDKDDILIQWACEYLFRSIGRPDLAKAYDEIALARAGEAKATDEDRPDMDASLSDMGGETNGTYWANPFIRGTPTSGS